MGRTDQRRLLLFTALPTLVGPLACDKVSLLQPATVKGIVVDYGGRPLPGVAVKVRKSQYTATTDEEGKYAVEFAPGTFEIEFSKPAHTTTVLALDIQQTVDFPAESVELFPMPAETGLYLLGPAAPIKLEPAAMDKQTFSEGWMSSSFKVFCTGEGKASFASGNIRVLDTSAQTMMPARLGGYGLVFQPEKPYSKDEADKGYNGLFKDEMSMVGEERLVVRTFEAEPGKHAFVTIGRNIAGEQDLDPSKPCYPFEVE